MTAIGASPWDLIYDLFLALGFSVAVWFCYHLLTLFVNKKHLWLTIPLHVLFFAMAGFLSFCFIVGQTTSRQPRWYMALGFALGAWIYFAWFARYIRYMRDLIIQTLKLLVAPLRWFFDLLRRRVAKPIRQYLQKQRQMIYNKRMEARAKKRTARDIKDDGQAKPKKEPVRAYRES